MRDGVIWELLSGHLETLRNVRYALHRITENTELTDDERYALLAATHHVGEAVFELASVEPEGT